MSIVYILEPSVLSALGEASNPGILDLRGVVLRYEILDYTRRSVRLLVDNPNGAIIDPVSWDGNDDEGDPVPNGIYYARILARDADGAERLFESKLMLQEDSAEGLLRRKHALTDVDGRFQIPMELFPIGEKITVSDQDGQGSRDVSISATVQIYALRMVAGDIVFSQQSVPVGNRTASIHADLTLP